MYSYYMPRKVLSEDIKKKGAELGRTVKSAREKLGLSQEQLAIKSDVRIETLKSIECGRVSTPNVFIISNLAVALKGDLNKWLK